MPVIPTDIVEKQFSELTVISYMGYFGTGKSLVKKHQYKVSCSCGVIKTMSRQNILTSTTCGCGNRRAIADSNSLRGDKTGRLVWQQLYKSHLKVSKERGIISELTFEQFIYFSTKSCYYCGVNPHKKKYSRYTAIIYLNGIDRIDNDVGYTFLNSRPCCEYCNRMKLDRTEEEFFKKIKLIYEKHLNNNDE